MMTDPLSPLRAQLDSINSELLILLGQRFEVVEKIKQVKLQEGLATYDPERVSEMLHDLRGQWEAQSLDPALWPAVEMIFQTIFKSAVEYQLRR